MLQVKAKGERTQPLPRGRSQVEAGDWVTAYGAGGLSARCRVQHMDSGSFFFKQSLAVTEGRKEGSGNGI